MLNAVFEFYACFACARRKSVNKKSHSIRVAFLNSIVKGELSFLFFVTNYFISQFWA
ncbi:MAG: hypothetical protein ACJAZH_001313 [Roseivirga sp.]|jgi:hypothetical protein